MKLLLSAGVAILLTLGALPTVSAADAGSRGNLRQQAQRFEQVASRTHALSYLLHLPQGYEAQGARRWPLMVFLHGAGERGTNLAAVAVHGPPKLVESRPEFPAVVVSPQCPANTSWDVETLDALLSDLLARHAVDPKRVVLTGLSMGGYGTWAWAIAHPERFAGIAPICGGGSTIDLLLASGTRREHLRQLPVWAFHGAKDTVVVPAESERMVEAFKRLGNSPRLTVDPEAGHDSWTAAYQDPAVQEWLLTQRRP